MKILEWGIYLIALCLPLYLVRFKIFNIPTTVLEIMIYILFIVWLIKVFKFGKFKRLLTTHCSLFIAVLLILIGLSLATVFSSDLRTSAGIWKAWFIDALLFFIILITTIKTSKQIKNVLYAFVSSGFIVSVISLIYLIQGKLDATGRLQAIYNSPNYLAMYIAPALIVGFGLWILVKNRLGKILLFIVLCSLFITLCCTQSFGAYMGIITALCFGLILYLYKLEKKKLIYGVIFLGLIVILILSYSKFTSEQGKLSLNARLTIWQKAWQIFKANPILGIGPGTFEDYFPPYPEWGVPQPHNFYLAFLLQTGIIGFIGFIWLLVWFFRKGFKMFSIQHSAFGILLMMVMIYILVHGLVDTQYWKNDLSIIFWLIIGLMVILSRHSLLARSGSSIS
jgi:O-antigen ligase